MKNTVICFRISSELRSALEKISRTDRRSLSATIENILYAFLDGRDRKGEGAEKRSFPRKKISAPALISAPDGAAFAAMVHDISFGGIRVSTPSDFHCVVREDFSISVVFTLPQSEKPLLLRCSPRHLRTDERLHIGASFMDDDGNGRRDLLRYLMN